MNRPSFVHGALGGVAASIAGAGAFWSLSLALGTDHALRLTIAALSGAHVAFVLKACRTRNGRAVTVAAWTLTALGAWFTAPALLVYVILHVLFLWVVRALHAYASLITALADLGLCAVSVMTATAAALHTGSALLAFWCFFLVQAMWVAIPRSLKPLSRPDAAEPPAGDRFQQAYTVAEAAVRKLASII